MTETPWTLPTPPEADGPTVGDARPMVVAYLGWQRRTLLNICAGLTGEQLASRPIPSTTISLLGLIRHLGKVERIWFRERFAAEDVPSMFPTSQGWNADFDRVDAAHAQDDLARLVAEWELCDAATAALDFDATIERGGETLSLRFIYLHVIHEYARHNGHADLVREAIDGVTGR